MNDLELIIDILYWPELKVWIGTEFYSHGTYTVDPADYVGLLPQGKEELDIAWKGPVYMLREAYENKWRSVR